MNKTASICIVLGLILILGIVFIGGSKDSAETGQGVANSEIKDGVQYITISARGGYSPKISNAAAGIPTKLIVKTNGTYDCSAALVIRSIGFQKILAKTGEEVIDIGTPKAGEPLQGVCGMGMYNFVVNFS
jgi:uncharacterized protein